MADRADLVVVGAGTIGGWASVFARADGIGFGLRPDRAAVPVDGRRRVVRPLGQQQPVPPQHDPPAATGRPTTGTGRSTGRIAAAVQPCGLVARTIAP